MGYTIWITSLSCTILRLFITTHLSNLSCYLQENRQPTNGMQSSHLHLHRNQISNNVNFTSPGVNPPRPYPSSPSHRAHLSPSSPATAQDTQSTPPPSPPAPTSPPSNPLAYAPSSPSQPSAPSAKRSPPAPSSSPTRSSIAPRVCAQRVSLKERAWWRMRCLAIRSRGSWLRGWRSG